MDVTIALKVNVKMRTLDIVLLRDNLTQEALRYGARCKGSHCFTSHPHVYLQTV